MIDKPAIKLYINGCTIVTTGRYSTFLLTVDPPVAKKKNVRKIRKFFLPLCFLSDAKNELSSQQQSALLHVQKNMYQISTKITKRSVNDSTNQFLKREKKKKHFASLHFSSSFFITSERRRKGRESNPVHATREPQQFDDRGWRGESNAVLLAEL